MQRIGGSRAIGSGRQTKHLPVALLLSLLAAAATTVGVLAGGVDVGAVQSEVREQVRDDIGQRAAVQCPESVEWEAGASFSCRVTGWSDWRGDVIVHMDDEAGAFHGEWAA